MVYDDRKGRNYLNDLSSNNFNEGTRVRNAQTGNERIVKVVGAVVVAAVIAAIYYLSDFRDAPAEVRNPTKPAVHAPAMQLTTPEHSVGSMPTIKSSEPEEVTVTLENYRFKGDSQRITCSGTTGNISCKAAQPQD
ncbi:hypothetical protein [Pseudoduganella violaceinigra]|uniref:hypothetical protein n=1 Tax=Pseudoduganella violaceinigra TaxID=246602 RepID=UPI0012B53440|nr:hypothetical protein [Pseudoduganella violaceinigra]